MSASVGKEGRLKRLVFDRVTKRYDKDVVAVSGLSLRVEAGEFFVLVGPSGCGKSTILRMVAGLEKVTDGTIKIGDKVINDLVPGERNVSMVFQNYALFPHKTVFENMAFGLRIRKVPKSEIERLVREAASLLELTEHLGKYPRQLSGGQQQRTAVGRALVKNPDVFLFDEPLSNLDAKLRTTMRAELLRLHTRLGTTMLYVTHDQVEAMTLGDRICVMDGGKVQQTDVPQRIYDNPANTFVASFIGSPPMNIISGVLSASGSGFEVVLGGGVRLRLDDSLFPRQALEANVNKRVFVGIRPGAFSITGESSGSNAIEAAVEMVELIGEQKQVHFRLGEQKLVASIDASAGLDVGTKAVLHVKPRDINLFDAAGKSIRSADISGDRPRSEERGDD